MLLLEKRVFSLFESLLAVMLQHYIFTLIDAMINTLFSQDLLGTTKWSYRTKDQASSFFCLINSKPRGDLLSRSIIFWTRLYTPKSLQEKLASFKVQPFG